MASEFRKHRLVARLFDCFGISAPPAQFVSILGKEHSVLANENVDWDGLMSRASDPAKLQRIADEMRQDDQETELRCLLALVQRIMQREAEGAHVPVANASSLMGGDSAVIMAAVSNAPHESSHQSTSASEPSSAVVGGVCFVPFRATPDSAAGRYSPAAQEALLVEDMLGVLLGHPGRFVYAGATAEEIEDSDGEAQSGTSGAPTYCVDDTLDRSLVEAAVPALVAGATYSRLALFARTRRGVEQGRVCQALCSAVHDALGGFRRFVVDLEQRIAQAKGTFGLHQLLFHVAPQQHGLQVLSSLVNAVEAHSLRGGAILVALELAAASHAGDRAAHSLLIEVLLQTSRPFMAMLHDWLLTGTLDDPAGEFVVRPRTVRDSTPLGSEAHALSSAFVVLQQNVPSVLAGHMLNRAVQVGAIHAALREISSASQSQSGSFGAALESLKYDAQSIAAGVEAALAHVNGRMLAVLFANERLANALRLCKRVYLMESADAVHSFLDAMRDELEKPARAVIAERLRTAWEAAVRSCPGISTADETECCAMPQIVLADMPLAEQLLRISGGTCGLSVDRVNQGIELLSVKLRFGFPESLVFDPDSLAKYELLFRLQLALADTGRKLASAAVARGAGSSRAYHVLRRQALHCVSGVHQYIAHDVIEPAWRRLEEGLVNAKDIDAVIGMHTAFLDSALRQAMLTNGRLVSLLTRLLAAAADVASLGTHPDAQESALSNVHATFDAAARAFLDALQYCSSRDYDYHLGTLHARLEHNMFYAAPGATQSGGLVQS